MKTNLFGCTIAHITHTHWQTKERLPLGRQTEYSTIHKHMWPECENKKRFTNSLHVKQGLFVFCLIQFQKLLFFCVVHFSHCKSMFVSSCKTRFLSCLFSFSNFGHSHKHRYTNTFHSTNPNTQTVSIRHILFLPNSYLRVFQLLRKPNRLVSHQASLIDIIDDRCYTFRNQQKLWNIPTYTTYTLDFISMYFSMICSFIYQLSAQFNFPIKQTFLSP